MKVVLDPGHDGTHAGASGFGVQEADLTLKIATYCKEELSTYNGITVYMTRESASCPAGGEIILHVWMPVQTLQRMWEQMC